MTSEVGCVTGAARVRRQEPRAVALRQRQGRRGLSSYDVGDSPSRARAALCARADVVFHLAGVNRPREASRSSRPATPASPARSARATRAGARPHAEDRALVLDPGRAGQPLRPSASGAPRRRCAASARATGARGRRLPAARTCSASGAGRTTTRSIATFCHNIARDLPIQISDPGTRASNWPTSTTWWRRSSRELDATGRGRGSGSRTRCRRTAITLGELAEHDPELPRRAARPCGCRTTRRPVRARALRDLPVVSRAGGSSATRSTSRRTTAASLAEFLKSPHFGQIFVSRTKPGITRGNHYHHTKIEKFMVVAGRGVIRFRQIDGGRGRRVSRCGARSSGSSTFRPATRTRSRTSGPARW